MSFSNKNLLLLKVFLDDVANVAYNSMDDQTAAETMNALSETRVKSSLSGAEIFKVVDSGEFDLLTATDRTEWLQFCSIDSLDPGNGSPAHAAVERIFGNPSATRTSLVALRSESVSPATLAGLPRVRADYVRRARLLP